ncbi:MAG: hypothetical protein M3N50_03575 [Pseudomonadota bacterium]|nr:hypothetical protein [Pseudomonadota bacterium]
MNRVTNLMGLAFVIASGTLIAMTARADEAVGLATPTKQEMMKDCIEKQKTADVTMSKAQMKRICRDRFKQQKVSGTPLDAPASDTPRP